MADPRVEAKLKEIREAVEAENPTPRQKVLKLLAALQAMFYKPRGTAKIIETSFAGFSSQLRAIQGNVIPNCLCGCKHSEHSKGLVDHPCLNCGDCVAYMPAPKDMNNG